jgi:hypothetical protein
MIPRIGGDKGRSLVQCGQENAPGGLIAWTGNSFEHEGQIQFATSTTGCS